MNSVPTRDAVPAELKWDLTDIYPDEDAWRQDLGKLEASIKGYEQGKSEIFKGTGW